MGRASVRLTEMAGEKYDIAIFGGDFLKKMRKAACSRPMSVGGQERAGGEVQKITSLHQPLSDAGGINIVFFELQGLEMRGSSSAMDNNIIENVRATALLGAQIIFMPHVTMCTPSTPGRGAGFVDCEASGTTGRSDPTSPCAWNSTG